MSFIASGWFGSILGIFGLLLSIYFYFKQKRNKKLSYQMSSLEIIQSLNTHLTGEFQIKINDYLVTRLVKNQIVIWNSGNITIDGKDIVETDRLKIMYKDNAHVISMKILASSRIVNNFGLTNTEEGTVFVDFDYVDPGDGVLIEVLHTSSENYATITGTIKGNKETLKNTGTVDYPIIRLRNKKGLKYYLIMTAFHLISSIILCGMIYAFELYFFSNIKKSDYLIKSIFFGVGIYAGIVSSTKTFKRRKKISMKMFNHFNS